MRRRFHRFALMILLLTALNALGQVPVDQQWVAFYDGQIHGEDRAWAVIVDQGGHAIVTGGVQNLTSGQDWATIKYDSSGAAQWTAIYNGPDGGDEYARAMTLGSDGDVYACGFSQGDTTGMDYLVIKYDAWGTQEWTVRYDGPAHSDDEVADLAMDTQGNLIVTGTSIGLSGSEDYATVKIGPEGDTLWTALYNSPQNGRDEPVAIGVDSAGNVFVTGTSWDPVNGDYWITVKYDPEGAVLWLQNFFGLGQGGCEAYDLAVNASGYVVVTGHAAIIPEDYGITTILYNPDGDTVWIRQYLEGGPEIVYGVQVDPWGNIIVTGNIDYHQGAFNDIVVIKYDALGNQLWARTWDGPFHGDDGINLKMASDKFGNVYLSGASENLPARFDYVTLKYNAVGDLIWTIRYESPNNGLDWPTGIALSPDNHFVYVTGYGYNWVTGFDYTTVQYRQYNSPPTILSWEPAELDTVFQGDTVSFSVSAEDLDGDSLRWQWALNGQILGQDSTAVVIFESLGSQRVSARISDAQSADSVVWNFVVVEPSGIIGRDHQAPTVFMLCPPKPNPFNAVTAISYELQAASYVKLTVWDTTGRLATTLVDGWRKSGRQEVQFEGAGLSSGIYIVQLQAGSFRAGQKVVLMK